MKTNVENLKAKTQELLEEGKNTFKEMDEFSEWNSLGEIVVNMGKISSFINKLVMAVEIAANDAFDDAEGFKSEDKVEAAAQLMDDMIELPFFLEAIDKKVFSLMISMAVEGLNTRFGHEWDMSVLRKSVKNSVDVVSKISHMYL